MIGAVKLAVCGAILAAFTTAAQANLIEQGTPTDTPLLFSTTLLLNRGEGGSDVYLSDSENWSIGVSASSEILSIGMLHLVAPHSPPESAPGISIALLAIPLASQDESTATEHGPDHFDVLSWSIEPIAGSSPVWRITVTASHESPGVPDAASSLMLLGLGLTGLGTVRRFVRC